MTSLLTPLLLGTSAIFVSNLNKSSNSCRKDDEILKKRTFDGLTQETKSLIELITIQKGTFPVGSFKFKAHRYPGDIDIFEPVKACCDKESASKEIAKKIQKMALEISKRKDVYLGDFKAGLDFRYTTPMSDIEGKLNELVDLELITQEELQEALSLKSRDELVEYMRKYYIVRWSLEELIQGYKLLPKGLRLELSDALTHKSIVKIDLWAPQDGNYNEVTNFFLIVMIGKDGKEVVLNEELGDRLINLNHDIVKYGSKEHKNSLKLAKRLWNRALFLGDKKIPKILYPLFQSGCNSLNQIAGESEVVRQMVERLPSPPIDILLRQIDGFRRRITDVFDVDFDPQPMYNIIINILNRQIDIVSGLVELESMIKKVVEKHAREFLNCNLSNIDSLIKEAKSMDKDVKKRLASDIDEEFGEVY